MRKIFLSLFLPLFLFLHASEGAPPLGEETRSQVATRGKIRGFSSRAAPKVAIIIDDLGQNPGIVRSFLNLEIPLAFSILPQLAHSEEIAELVHLNGMNVLFHLPMEPHQYPKIHAGAYSLLSSMGPRALERTLKEGLKSVPYVVGVNNHMGSKLTEDGAAMRVVMDCLKNLNLFFVDSVTTPKSKAFSVARETGLRTAKRNVFLDNRKEKGFILQQFRELKRSALTEGIAIGIGHPNSATLSVLREMIPNFEEAGIEFVLVSELVQ